MGDSVRRLYQEIYRSDPSSVILFMLICLLVWTVMAVLLGHARQTCRCWTWLNRILAGGAAIGVLGVTVVTRFVYGAGESGLSLIPFRVPSEAWRAEEYGRMLIMNAFLFFPLGLFLGYAWSPSRRPWTSFGLTAACGAGLSLLCELLQGLFSLGTVETDDLLLNTVGTMGGALSVLTSGCVWLFIRRLCRRLRQPLSNNPTVTDTGERNL